MAVLLVSPRFTPDSIALGNAARAAGWRVERLHRWSIPGDLAVHDVAVYGEPLFAAFVAENLSLALLEPPARAFAQGLLADPAVRLPPGVVVDVGRIAGQAWAVV